MCYCRSNLSNHLGLPLSSLSKKSTINAFYTHSAIGALSASDKQYLNYEMKSLVRMGSLDYIFVALDGGTSDRPELLSSLNRAKFDFYAKEMNLNSDSLGLEGFKKFEATMEAERMKCEADLDARDRKFGRLFVANEGDGGEHH